MRARRPLLPALTAVLAGALVAGAATMLSGPGAEQSADQPRLSTERTSERRSGPEGGLAPPRTTESGTPPTTGTSATTTTPPADPPPPPVTTTTTTTTDAPPATASSPDTSVTDQVVALTNAERQQGGCGPLTADGSIAAAAQKHAEDMASRDYFEHTTPEGVTFDQRIRSAGYSSPGAENIARGASTAEQVVELWMNSPGHRANILNCDLGTIGVGLDVDGFYWVQDFGF